MRPPSSHAPQFNPTHTHRHIIQQGLSEETAGRFLRNLLEGCPSLAHLTLHGVGLRCVLRMLVASVRALVSLSRS